MRKRTTALMCMVGALVCAVPVIAAAGTATSIKARVAAYRALGEAFKGVNDTVRRGDPSSVAMRRYVSPIRKAAKEQYRWFPKGSGAGKGVKTAAKANIWSDSRGFRAAQIAFAAQSAALQRAVAGGNARTIRSEARKLGGTCKSCHDTYRMPSD